MTAMVAFVLLLGDNVRALHEQATAHAEVISEQAFFASQSCLEEAYLRLRTDQTFRTIDNLVVGSATCSATVTPDPGNDHNGQITSTGRMSTAIREISSSYTDAGPTTTRNATEVVHIIDTSGSMDNDGDGCSRPAANSITCVAIGGLWGPQPLSTVKDATITFQNGSDSAHDAVGLVSFNTTATSLITNPALTYNYAAVRTSILGLSAGGRTNIGDGVAVATRLFTGGGSTKVEILLTDGVANEPYGDSRITDNENYARAKAQEAKDAGIMVVTIGLGSGVNGHEQLLRDMASDPSLYFFADDASVLQGIYSQILHVVTSYNIGQGTWHEQ